MKTVAIRVSSHAKNWLLEQCDIEEQEHPTIAQVVDALIMCYDPDFKEQNTKIIDEELKIKIQRVRDEIKTNENKLSKLTKRLELNQKVQIEKNKIDEEKNKIEDPKELMMKTTLF